MSKQQIAMNTNWLKSNIAEIARLEAELGNPRIRNIAGRKIQIENLKEQNAQIEAMLAA